MKNTNTRNIVTHTSEDKSEASSKLSIIKKNKKKHLNFVNYNYIQIKIKEQNY